MSTYVVDVILRREIAVSCRVVARSCRWCLSFATSMFTSKQRGGPRAFLPSFPAPKIPLILSVERQNGQSGQLLLTCNSLSEQQFNHCLTSPLPSSIASRVSQAANSVTWKMTTSMLACGKANAPASLKIASRTFSRSYVHPTANNGKHAARNEDSAMQRELLVNVLNANATRRDAKQYLARFKNAPNKSQSGPKPDLYSLIEERNARHRRDQDRLDKVGVNLGGLYSPARSIADAPQFTSEETPQQPKVPPREELHIALACIKSPELIDDDALDGLAVTIAQLVKLDMRMILVLDINVHNIQADGYSGSLPDVKGLRKTFAQQADRLCDAVDRHNPEGARSVPNALEVVEDILVNGSDATELNITMPNLLLDPLRRGMVPIVPALAYTQSGQLKQVPAPEIMTALSQYLVSVNESDEADTDTKPLLSLDRIIVLDPIGGIPSKDRDHGAHVFINLEQEFNPIMKELLEYGDSAEKDANSSRIPAFYDQHRENLDMVRKCLNILPPTSSALIATPREAASSSRTGNTQSPMLGAGTRRQKNPLIHNLLTNKPLISSSLPAARFTHAWDDPTEKPQPTETSTVLRRGMPLIIIPAADRLLGWQRPADGTTSLSLDNDSRVDLPRVVHLIEDSFRRKLNVQNYLDRVKGRIAGMIIAGNYEGGAILTWEMPPGVNDPSRLVPYLDKFAVLQSSQGSSGVADIVFQAMVRTCFPQGVCWRSRKDNPVNKWYFERAGGSWQIPDSNWTMFWTGSDVPENKQKWNDYVAVCSSIQASWASDGKKDD